MAETIAAISTAVGEGGIGIIRISGDDSKGILEKIFVPASKIGRELEARKLTYGHIVDPKDGSVVDEVLVAFMPAPHTYTCEDIVEINCHGSVVSLKRTLLLCYENGARPAEAGEFTKRAFLNGRIDLSQAEAVIDIIRAKTDSMFDLAVGQLEGRLSSEIRKIRAEILDILVNITVNIDYPDEDIEIVMYEDLANGLETACVEVQKLLSSAGSGKILREGLRVSIIGKPNVGKSSLMNALLKEGRAIVTDIPGTTRDVIEETLSIGGIPVVITDTAGIRETDDKIEKIGIERSKQSFNTADLIILMLDTSRELTEEDRELMRLASERNTILLCNKADVSAYSSEALGNEIAKEMPRTKVIWTSMASGLGLDTVEATISEMVYGGEIRRGESLLVTNARHEDLLRKANKALEDALELTRMGEPLEIIEIDINKAFSDLGEIIGESVSDDIISEVFSRFCLGK